MLKPITAPAAEPVSAYATITGTPITSGLAQKERELSNLSREYLTYANAITGHCPESLGVPLAEAFIHHYAGWEV